MNIAFRLLCAFVSILAINAACILGLGAIYGFEARKYSGFIGGAISGVVGVLIIAWPINRRR